MVDAENKEQVVASDEDEQDVPAGEKSDDALNVVELAPQPEVDALSDAAEAEPTPQFEAGNEQVDDVAEHAVAPAVAAESEKQGGKKPGSGIALPSFVERGAADALGGAGTSTGIPLPPREVKHGEDNNAEHPRPRQRAVVSEDEDKSSAEEVVAEEVVAEEVVAKEVVAKEVVAKEVVAKEVVAKEVVAKEVVAEEVVAKEVVEEQSEIRAEFSDTNSGSTPQAGVQFIETDITEGKEDILPARKLGAAITTNNLLAFEALATLADYPHLYDALLAVKGVWQSTVSMDDLIISNTQVGQSAQRMEEVKNWYAMRIKKLIVNVLDYCWVACAYEIGEDGLLVIDDEQLFVSLTGLCGSDFRELCSQGYIKRQQVATLVRQFRFWEAETRSIVDYIFVHLRRERMVA